MIPQLKTLPGTVHEGKTYFLPWDIGNISITYRSDLVEEADAETLGLMWNERYQGRLAVLDIAEDTIALTAMYAGFDPFKMTPEQTQEVRALLEKQRPLLKFYSSDIASLEQALASGELVAAMTWNLSAANLRKQGVPVKFMDPKEKRLTWVCGLCLSASAPQVDKAYDMLDAMLSPDVGAYMIDDKGLGHCNAKAYDLVSAERLQEVELTRDPAEFLGRGVFLDDYHNREDVIKMFEEVKTGL